MNIYIRFYIDWIYLILMCYMYYVFILKHKWTFLYSVSIKIYDVREFSNRFYFLAKLFSKGKLDVATRDKRSVDATYFTCSLSGWLTPLTLRQLTPFWGSRAFCTQKIMYKHELFFKFFFTNLQISLRRKNWCKFFSKTNLINTLFFAQFSKRG